MTSLVYPFAKNTLGLSLGIQWFSLANHGFSYFIQQHRQKCMKNTSKKPNNGFLSLWGVKTIRAISYFLAKEPPDHYIQNPAIILCRCKLAPTPPCAQTMHCTHSYTLLFPLWHVLEVLDRSCTDLTALCHLESPPPWRALRLCQAQFLFKSQISNVSSSQDTVLNYRQFLAEFFHAVTSLLQKFSSLWDAAWALHCPST